MGINRVAFLTCKAARVFLISAFTLSASASVQAFTATQEQREACTPDALRLCSSEIPDVSRVVACMVAKKASLSAPCRAVFEVASLDRRAAPSRRHRAHRARWTYMHHRKMHSWRHHPHYRISARR